MMGKVDEMTLTDFLLARIAEDEDVARATEWRDGALYSVFSYLRPRDGAHVDRHDPTRVLAECEAKRRIVEGLRWAIDDTYWVGDLDTHATGEQAERTLEALALPYADHPDYRDEWRP